jgi:uncharacterized membrane protein
MTAGVTRVLVALAGSAAVFAVWCLFIVAIMVVTLYISRLIPMTGRHRRSAQSRSGRWKELR